tara:strand:- start:741 stop:986 length:246 start_codon:yes stop_codon:yes gene_type:complete
MSQKPNRLRRYLFPYKEKSDNFTEWFGYYSPVMEVHYNDFVKLFDENPPTFIDFMDYCYVNTHINYNSTKRKYECRILKNY